MANKNINRVPMNIVAKTHGELSEKCRINMVINNLEFEYGVPFQYNSDIGWWTTFFAPLEQMHDFSMVLESVEQMDEFRASGAKDES